MAHQDLDNLADYCIGFAKQMLGKYGEFFPFGASIGGGGNLAADGLFLENEHPPSQSVIDKYTELYRGRAKTGELTAAAVFWDSRVSLENGPKTDAISIGLEHSNQESITVYVPYKKLLLRGHQFGEPAAARREPWFFTQD
jgi:hypothetical protein